MKRRILSFLSIAVLAGLLTACGGTQTAAPAAQVTPAKTDDKVIAEAQVVPARRAALSFEVGGTVAELLVKEGDAVAAGQVIARLESDIQTVSVAATDRSRKIL